MTCFYAYAHYYWTHTTKWILTHSWSLTDCLPPVGRPCRSQRYGCCSFHPGASSQASGLCDCRSTETIGTSITMPLWVWNIALIDTWFTRFHGANVLNQQPSLYTSPRFQLMQTPTRWNDCGRNPEQRWSAWKTSWPLLESADLSSPNSQTTLLLIHAPTPDTYAHTKTTGPFETLISTRKDEDKINNNKENNWFFLRC